MTAEILSVIILILITFLYYIAKSKGKTDAQNDQLIQTLKGKEFYDRTVDARMARLEAKSETWKQYIQGLDYSKLSDDQLAELHEGKTLDDLSPGTYEHTKPDKEPTD